MKGITKRQITICYKRTKQTLFTTRQNWPSQNAFRVSPIFFREYSLGETFQKKNLRTCEGVAVSSYSFFLPFLSTFLSSFNSVNCGSRVEVYCIKPLRTMVHQGFLLFNIVEGFFAGPNSREDSCGRTSIVQTLLHAKHYDFS